MVRIVSKESMILKEMHVWMQLKSTAYIFSVLAISKVAMGKRIIKVKRKLVKFPGEMSTASLLYDLCLTLL